MKKTIKVEITFESLPKQPNYHELSVALEAWIDDAVSGALQDAFEGKVEDLDFKVHVPSF